MWINMAVLKFSVGNFCFLGSNLRLQMLLPGKETQHQMRHESKQWLFIRSAHWECHSLLSGRRFLLCTP